MPRVTDYFLFVAIIFGMLLSGANPGAAASTKNLEALRTVGIGPNGTARLLRRHILTQRHLWSMVELGKMYLTGRGVLKDPLEAYTLFLMAANDNYAPAHFQLGLMHETGTDVPKNAGVAIAWFKSAAALDHRDAFPKLGTMLRDGIGIPTDQDQAMKWFQIGAKKGCPKSLAALLEML